VVNEIFVASRMLEYYWSRTPGGSRLEATRTQQREKHEAVFWEMDPGKDQLIPRITAAIETIEEICKPIIQDAS
jgi:hypothetical protein